LHERALATSRALFLFGIVTRKYDFHRITRTGEAEFEITPFICSSFSQKFFAT